MKFQENGLPEEISADDEFDVVWERTKNADDGSVITRVTAIFGGATIELKVAAAAEPQALVLIHGLPTIVEEAYEALSKGEL